MNQDFITKDILEQTGVALGTEEETTALLTHLNEQLSERVGSAITESLNESQLDALLDLQETATDKQLGDWLEQNVPEFKQIIQDEIDIILGEVAESSDDINTTN